MIGAWRSPGSALPWGGRGRGFKSRRSDIQKIINRIIIINSEIVECK